MTKYDKDDERIQNDEEEETQEPLLGAKPQAATIVSGSQGALKMGGSVVATPAPAPASGDIITQLVGEKGWWQLRTTMIVFLTKIPAAWFMACIIFTAPAPWEGQYECQLSDGSPANISQHPSQITADGSFVPDRCLLYSSNIINLTKSTEEKLKSFLITSLNPSLADEPTFPCEQFSFNLDYRTTLITQFDLVCTKAILVAITQCFHLMGVLIGGVIATEAMETCRPRRVMMLGLILQIVVGIATGYMPLFWLHVAARCAVAACCALTFTSGAVIMADIWGGRYKTMVSANFENMWAIGVILLPAIGYFTKTWAQIYITISLPLTVVIMILWWWIPDPPRWHLERSDVKTAQEILENAVLVNNNRTSIPDNLHGLLKIEAHDLIGKRAVVSKSEWRHLLSMKGAWWRVLFVVTSWSLMFTCYYGCLLNIRGFGRQYLYVNTAIAGAAELLGGLLGFFILMKTKHKWSCVGVLTGFTGILNCTIWFFPTHIDGSHFLYDLMTIAMINKVGISASLCVLTTCTAELFPLPHKKRVVYASTVCARIIFMTAPLIGFTNIFGDGVSLSSFGVLTVISGMATMLLNPLKIQQKENATTDVWTVKIDSNEQTKM